MNTGWEMSEEPEYFPIKEQNAPQPQAFDNYVAPALYFIIVRIQMNNNINKQIWSRNIMFE